jgi:hypothetical protein
VARCHRRHIEWEAAGDIVERDERLRDLAMRLL